MAKATIHAKSGAVITVEGTETEVSRIIAQYEAAEVSSRAPQPDKPGGSVRGKSKRRESASELVLDLKKQGFFEKPRTLGEVGTALEEKGFLYPVTTLSGVMLGLLKRGQVRRKKAEGRWVYGK